MKKLFIYITTLCIIVSNVNTAFALPRDWREISPQEAQKIVSVNVLGINLDMTLREIKTSLEKQGYNVQNAVHGYLVRENNIMLNVSYHHNSIDRYAPLDDSNKPLSIIHTINGKQSDNCSDMLLAVETFCTNGMDKFPCIKSRDLIKANIIPRKASSDGALYKMIVKIDPPLQCSIKLYKTIKR